MSDRLPREGALDADGDAALADIDSTSRSAFRPFPAFDSGSSIFNLNPPNLRSEPRGSRIEPPILPPATLFCRHCHRIGWGGPQELLDHTKEAHGILKKAFPCFDCRLAGFTRKRRLVNHQLSGDCLGPSWELLYERAVNCNQTTTAYEPHSFNGVLPNSDSGEDHVLRPPKIEGMSSSSSAAQVKQLRGSNIQKGPTGCDSLSHLFPDAENREHFIDGVDKQMSERNINGHALSVHVPSTTHNTAESANFSRKRHCSDSYTRDLLPRQKVLKADPDLAVSQGTVEKCQNADVPASKNHVHQKTTVLREDYISASQTKLRTTHPSCRRSLLDWESFISSSNSTKRPPLPKQNDGNVMNEPNTDSNRVRRTKFLPRSKHHTDDSVAVVSSSNKLSTAHGKSSADTSLSTSNDSQSSVATRTVLEIENKNSSSNPSFGDVTPSKANSDLSDKKESLQISSSENEKDFTRDASCSKAKRLRTEGKSSRLPTGSSNRARTKRVTEGKSACLTDSESSGTKKAPPTIQTSTQRPSDASTSNKVNASSDVNNGLTHLSVVDEPKESNASPVNSPMCDLSLRTTSPDTISTDEVCARSGEADLFSSKSSGEDRLAPDPSENTRQFSSASSLSSTSDDIKSHSSCEVDVKGSHSDNPDGCLSFEESQKSRTPISVNFKEFIQIVREGATKRRSMDKVTAVNAQVESDSYGVRTEKEELVPIHFQPFEDIDQRVVSKHSLSGSSDSVDRTSADTTKEISTSRRSKQSYRRTRNISKRASQNLLNNRSCPNNQSGILPILSAPSEFGSDASTSNSLSGEDLPSSASNTIIEGIVISRSVLHPRKSIVSSSNSCCPYCARVCIDPRSLERHLRACKSKPVNIPVQSFCAEIANKSDAGSATLTGSGAILRKSPSEDELKLSFRERIPCPRCSLLFTGPKFFARHLQMCRGHGEKSSEPLSPSQLRSESLVSPKVASADSGFVVCPNCSARFLRFRYMRKHLLKCLVERQKDTVNLEEGLNSSNTDQKVVTGTSDDPLSPLSRLEQYKTFTCPHCARKFWKEPNMLSHAKRCRAGTKNSLSSRVKELPTPPDSVSSSREQKDNSEKPQIELESNAVDTNTAVSDRQSPVVATVDSDQGIIEQMSADRKSSDDKNTDGSLLSSKPAIQQTLLSSKPAPATADAAQTSGFKSPKKTISAVHEQSTPTERGRRSKIASLVRAGKGNVNSLILRSRLRSHSSTPLSRRRSVLSERSNRRPNKVKYLCSPDLRSPGLRLRIRKSSLENPSRRWRSRSVSSRSSDTASSATIAARIREQRSSRRRSSVNSLEDAQSTVSDATTAPAIAESVSPTVKRQRDSVNKPVKCRYCHRTGFRSARLCSVHERNCSRRKFIVGRRRHTAPGNSITAKDDSLVKMWPCEQCASLFKTRSELRAHRETGCGHTGQSTSLMSCPGCPKNAPGFPTTEALLTHLLSLKAGPGHPYGNHGSLATAAVWPSFLSVPNLGFGCHICGLLLASETRLDKHKRAVHEAWLQDEQEKAISPQKNG
ncbi:unnamed protein product [Calicophoron daubneyi]|uniref:C2H2-type domain-containing protein n=1 Tax=Calicophoron daubneyi TaxID=300641 RepID=A0AAV2TZX6_CALDB